MIRNPFISPKIEKFSIAVAKVQTTNNNKDKIGIKIESRMIKKICIYNMYSINNIIVTVCYKMDYITCVYSRKVWAAFPWWLCCVCTAGEPRHHFV